MDGNNLILALDIGTSSTRTALFDGRGRRLVATTAQRAYRVRSTADGGAELSPGLLRDAVMDCLGQTLRHRSAPRSRRIVAAGMSCFWHSLVGTDADGRALTPVYTWADSRCRQDAARLRSEMSERAVHRRTGCMLRASFWPAKLLWLKRTQPRLFRRVEHWMSPAEWLLWQIGGVRSCGLSMASGTGLFNPTMLTWDDALLNRCGLRRSQLNPLAETPLPTAERFARQFPELQEARWFPAIGDGAASNLGSGATEPGLIAINFGTSAAVRAVRTGSKAQAPFGLFCYRLDAARHLVGGAVSNAGNLWDWSRRELRLPQAPRILERLMARRPAPEHGLTVLPFWFRERAPTWPEQLPAIVVGITQSTTALDLAQALQEAVFYRLAEIAGLLAQDQRQPLRFAVSGGLAKSRAGLQRLADVLGRPVAACAEPEASLRGAAVFALEKLGIAVPPLRPGPTIQPRPSLTRRHAAARQRQQKLEHFLPNAATDSADLPPVLPGKSMRAKGLYIW